MVLRKKKRKLKLDESSIVLSIIPVLEGGGVFFSKENSFSSIDRAVK